MIFHVAIDDIFLAKTRIQFSLYVLKFSEVFSFADQGQRKSFDDERALENAKYEVFLRKTFWYFTKTTM